MDLRLENVFGFWEVLLLYFGTCVGHPFLKGKLLAKEDYWNYNRYGVCLFLKRAEFVKGLHKDLWLWLLFVYVEEFMGLDGKENHRLICRPSGSTLYRLWAVRQTHPLYLKHFPSKQVTFACGQLLEDKLSEVDYFLQIPSTARKPDGNFQIIVPTVGSLRTCVKNIAVSWQTWSVAI